MYEFPTIAGYVYEEEEAASVAGILASKGAWFEFEPHPDGVVCFRVKDEPGSEAVKTLSVHTATTPEDAFPPYHIGRVLGAPVLSLLLQALAELRMRCQEDGSEDALLQAKRVGRLEEGFGDGIEETVDACREINAEVRAE